MSIKLHKDEVNLILDRIGLFIGDKSRGKIAEALGVTPSTIGNWPERGTLGWVEIHHFAKKNGIPLDWIFAGKKFKKALPDFYKNTLKNYPFIESVGETVDENLKSNKSLVYIYKLIIKMLEIEIIKTSYDKEKK